MGDREKEKKKKRETSSFKRNGEWLWKYIAAKIGGSKALWQAKLMREEGRPKKKKKRKKGKIAVGNPQNRPLNVMCRLQVSNQSRDQYALLM